MILAEYRPQLQKRAISGGIQQPYFYPPAGGRLGPGHPPDLDNGLNLNNWDQKGRIKLLRKQAWIFSFIFLFFFTKELN